MNLLDYNINWNTKSSFDSLSFNSKYFFLYTLLLHLKLFNKKYSNELSNSSLQIQLEMYIHDEIKKFSDFVTDKKNMTELGFEKEDLEFSTDISNITDPDYSENINFNTYDSANLKSVINYSITYLEKYCNHDRILMDIRFLFQGYSYNEFQNLKPTNLRNRLIELVINNIKNFSNNSILVGVNEFYEFKPEINHQSIFNSINESVPNIIRKIKSAKNNSYLSLLIEPKPYNNQSEHLDTSFDRIKQNYSHILEEGISIDTFTVDEGNDLDFIIVDDDGNEYDSTPNVPQKVGIFHLEKSLDCLHNIIEALIKLSVINELETVFKTSTTYKSPIFTVKGPSEAVDKYSSHFVNQYNLNRPTELAKKLEIFCYKETKSGELKRLNRNSIVRIIRRRKIF
ncbi:MAG: hypothetical protein RLN83_08420 [Balneola sp.]